MRQHKDIIINLIITDVDKKHISKRNRKHHNPNFTHEVHRLIRERNNLRNTPIPHTYQTTRHIQDLNQQITGKITKTRTENGKNFVESLDRKTNSSKLYKTIRNITNSNTNASQRHAAITTDANMPSRQKQADTLIHHYASISKVRTTIADRHTHRLKHKPITLLCTPSKVVERLILKVTTPHKPLSPTQHGYRPHHSTITLLTNIAQNMQDINSRKPAKRTLLLTIDISEAFDVIPRYHLIKKIYNTELHNTKRWFANYLSGRQVYVHYSGKSSKTLNIPNGEPQGSVLSPTLFNLYMHDKPQPPENIHIASYADDITITSTHSNVDTCATQVQDYMGTITTWMNTNTLKIAPTKSTATLLTSHNAEHQHRPTVTLQNTTIPHTHTHTFKILGVTFNTPRSFSQHMDEVLEKCDKRQHTPYINRHQLRTIQRNLNADILAVHKISHFLR
ncbi:Reverse transcriptase domain [Trinorchestia longiramus]|nr:Reverse transcriptase domain [Trinorchestia longiramus]